MTGPEQHAATVRDALYALDAYASRLGYVRPAVNGDARAALDELVALASEAERLAGRADELEAAGEAGLLVPLDASAVRLKAAEARADELATELATAKTTMKAAIWDMEAAEARADELQGRLYAIENMPPDGYLAINVEAMRPSDELEQARREADQLRAALTRLRENAGEPGIDYPKALADQIDAALAGVQAEEQTT